MSRAYDNRAYDSGPDNDSGRGYPPRHPRNGEVRSGRGPPPVEETTPDYSSDESYDSQHYQNVVNPVENESNTEDYYDRLTRHHQHGFHGDGYPNSHPRPQHQYQQPRDQQDPYSRRISTTSNQGKRLRRDTGDAYGGVNVRHISVDEVNEPPQPRSDGHRDRPGVSDTGRKPSSDERALARSRHSPGRGSKLSHTDLLMLQAINDLEEQLGQYDESEGNGDGYFVDDTKERSHLIKDTGENNGINGGYTNLAYHPDSISDDVDHPKTDYPAEQEGVSEPEHTPVILPEDVPPELNERILAGGTIRWRKKISVPWGIKGAKLARHNPSGGNDGAEPPATEQEGGALSDRNFHTEIARIYSMVRGEPASDTKEASKREPGHDKWKDQRSKKWRSLERQWREVLTDWEIWKGAFKKIEGNFGAAVVSYFRFMKWLFFLNLTLALIVLGVIIFPQEFMEPDNFEDSISNSSSDYVAKAVDCSERYIQYLDSNNKTNWDDQLFDLFQGTGYMEYTLLFYGYYFNKTYEWSAVNTETQFYNMPLAYILTILVYLLLSLFLMVRYTGVGVRENLLHRGEEIYHTCNKVLSGWDFNLVKKKNVELRQKNIRRELESDLAEQKRNMERVEMEWYKKWSLYCVRIIINLIIIVILILSGYLIFFVSEKTKENELHWIITNDDVTANAFLTLVVEFLPSITITALNFIMPVIFELMARLENYSPDSELQITIVRTVFLRLSSLAILIWTMSQQVDEPGERCGRKFYCWETYVGQQFYKLVIFDFGIVVSVTFLVEFPRRMIVKYFQNVRVIQFVGLQEFLIPQHVLDLVYTQSLCWLGALFCPLIPAVTVIKLFIFFYIKKLTVLNNCIPSSKPYRTSRSNTFFLTVLLLSFVVVAAPVIYVITTMEPSQGCGPFRIHSKMDGYAMFTAFTDALFAGPTWLRRAIGFFSTWMFAISAAIIIAIIIYIYWARIAANRFLIKNLKEELAREGKDKQFLLNQVRRAIMHGQSAHID